MRRDKAPGSPRRAQLGRGRVVICRKPGAASSEKGALMTEMLTLPVRVTRAPTAAALSPWPSLSSPVRILAAPCLRTVEQTVIHGFP